VAASLRSALAKNATFDEVVRLASLSASSLAWAAALRQSCRARSSACSVLSCFQQLPSHNIHFPPSDTYPTPRPRFSAHCHPSASSLKAGMVSLAIARSSSSPDLSSMTPCLEVFDPNTAHGLRYLAVSERRLTAREIDAAQDVEHQHRIVHSAVQELAANAGDG